MFHSIAGLLDVCMACSESMKEKRLGKALEGRLKAKSSGKSVPCSYLCLLHLSCSQV